MSAPCAAWPASSPCTRSRPARAAALDDAGYLALADRLQRHLDPLWNEPLGRYDPGPGATTRRSTGTCCSSTRVAALHGHDGPARNDQRARRSRGS